MASREPDTCQVGATDSGLWADQMFHRLLRQDRPLFPHRDQGLQPRLPGWGGPTPEENLHPKSQG